MIVIGEMKVFVTWSQIESLFVTWKNYYRKEEMIINKKRLMNLVMYSYSISLWRETSGVGPGGEVEKQV